MKTLLLTLGAVAAALPGPGPRRPAAPLCRAGETNLYSFTTKTGKTVSVCRGPRDGYLVYRYGTAAKTELQYPAVLDASSWKKFRFSSYLRGGGIQNEGLDLNSLIFTNAGVRYAVYQDDSARGGPEIGVRVRVKGKEVDLAGRPGTERGSLIDLRGNDKVVQSEEIE